MKISLPELPKGGWTRAIAWSITITTFVSAIAMIGSYYGSEWFDDGANAADILVALVLAGFITPPITLFLLVKVQQLRVANERLRIYATTDGLTGVLSREAFTSDVERHLAAYAGDVPRIGESAGSLLILDVDNFKRVNDNFGHQQGDIALRLIAAAIRSNVRSFDRVGRLGGEEFGVFLVDSAPEFAKMTSERIRHAITQLEFAPNTQRTQLSISIGVSTSQRSESFVELYHGADMNLYKAKSLGRNKVVMDDWAEDVLPPKPVPAPFSSVA